MSIREFIEKTIVCITTQANRKKKRFARATCKTIVVRALFACGTIIAITNIAENTFAQERPYYKYQLSVEQKLLGSTLIICHAANSHASKPRLTQDTHNAEPFFFEFKRRAYGTLASNVASSWQGREQRGLRRSTLEGSSVLAAHEMTDTSCAILLERRDSLFLGEINRELHIVRLAALPVSSSASFSILTSALNGENVRLLRLGAGNTIALVIAGRLFWWQPGTFTNLTPAADNTSDTILHNGILHEDKEEKLSSSALISSSSSSSSSPLSSRAGGSVKTSIIQHSSNNTASNSNTKIVQEQETSPYLLPHYVSRHNAAPLDIRLLAAYTVSDIVILNEFTQSDSDPACALLRESGVRKEVIILAHNGKELWTESLDVQRSTKLSRVSNFSVAACVEQGQTTMVYIIRPRQRILSTGISAPPERICFWEEPGRISVLALTQNNSTGKYLWEAVHIPFGSATFSEILWTFPENVFVPLSVTNKGNEFWCVFMNALYVMDITTIPIAAGRISTRFGFSPAIGSRMAMTARTLIHSAANESLVSIEIAGETLLVARTSVPFWWLRNIVRDVWIYGVVVIVLGIIIALLYIVRYQNRLLTTLFGAPGADVMIILDEEGKLQTLNAAARTLLNVAQEVPLRRVFQYYCLDTGAAALNAFAREALKLRTHLTKPISFQRPLLSNAPNPSAALSAMDSLSQEELETEPHDFLFTAIPIQTRFGAMRGVMLTGKDITEELGKKKLGNWAQLAHDLQTNLAAIRLNTEKILSSGANPEAQKILYQVNLIIKRVRDIITIGKSEELDKRIADTADICANVRKEFDDALFAHTGFEVHAQHILFECDQLKLERALRNAVENGIRALPNGIGVITIRAWLEERDIVCFQVQDTGEGMSADVQKNMMRKGFTTFGSKGGSGMGTMIMKYIVQLHGGEMLIHSEKGKGTAVLFRFPSRSAKHLQHLRPLEMLRTEHSE